MNRKRQRCPYCGKRMSYFSAFYCRRKAEYVCTRCGKESRVVISKIIIPIFIIAAVISLAIMGVWFWLKYLSNPLGIVLVAAPLVIFLFITPKFVQLEPLKKYQKSMEAKKAGKEFSDNFTAFDTDDEISSSLENSGQFKIDSSLFNQIKSERSSSKIQAESDEIVSNSEKLDDEEYVNVIGNVREDHVKTTSYPLKKLHSEGSKVERPRHYIIDAEEEFSEQPEPAEEVKEYKRPDTNKYSGNRRF